MNSDLVRERRVEREAQRRGLPLSTVWKMDDDKQWMRQGEGSPTRWRVADSVSLATFVLAVICMTVSLVLGWKSIAIASYLTMCGALLVGIFVCFSGPKR